MPRRSTSVIQPVGSTQAPSAASVAVLHEWLVAARQATWQAGTGPGLGADQSEPEALRHWQIHQGQLQANPAALAGDESRRRSRVRRKSMDDGSVRWVKTFLPTQEGAAAASANEMDLLYKLSSVPSTAHDSPRSHVAWALNLAPSAGTAGGAGAQRQSTRIDEAGTMDAGPSLETWQLWVPCSLLGAQQLPVPLFAQPLFLAALLRRLLVALKSIAANGFVHNDIKPDNLGLALPAAWPDASGVWQASWPLLTLPLRLMDFELGHAPGLARQPLVSRANTWASPYVRACHARAQALAEGRERNAQLEGIDWGADLWALGHMLQGWCDEAERLLAAQRDDIDTALPDGPDRHAAMHLLEGQQAGLQPLRNMVSALQALDRAEAQAANTSLAWRPDLPHDRLRSQIESLFPALAPGARQPPELVVLMLPPGPAAAAPRRRWAWPAWRLPPLPRLRPRHGLAAAAVLLLAGLVLARASLLQHGAGGLVAAAQWLGAPVLAAQAAPWRLGVARSLLGAAETLQTGRRWPAVVAMLQALPAVPQAKDLPAGTTADQLYRWRNAHGAAVQWLAALPDAPAKALRQQIAFSLLAVFDAHEGLRLLRQQPQPPDALAAWLAALDQLRQDQASALAALLQADALACWVAPVNPAALAGPLRQLESLPANAPSRSTYVTHARELRLRLQSGQSPCLWAEAGTATPATAKTN